MRARKLFRKCFSGVTFNALRPAVVGMAAGMSPTRPADRAGVSDAPSPAAAPPPQAVADKGSHQDRWVRYQSAVAVSVRSKPTRDRHPSSAVILL